MEELSYNGMREDIEVTASAINPLWVENDATDLKMICQMIFLHP